MWNALLDAGDPGVEVIHAFIVKEQLRRLLALPPNVDRELISHRRWQFYQLAADCEIPEVHRLAQTIETWWPAVEAAITTGYSNARSEGYNRLAKHVGRNALASATQPTTPDTVVMHPPKPAAVSQENRVARLSLKNQYKRDAAHLMIDSRSKVSRFSTRCLANTDYICV